jgi:hypothetical protein
MMRKWITPMVGVLALASTLTGCDNFLEGEGITTDPNQPSVATVDQLYNAMQARQFLWHNGDLARAASMFIQQMAGTDRQYIDRDAYNITENEFSTVFSDIYTGGGLVDLRQIQQLSEQNGDRVYAGIARVWEGYLVGMAASLWGDIPYSEAVGEAATPKLDDQAAVYAAVQGVLDRAITDLQSGTGRGPGALDRVYGGNAQQWVQAAHTLKARFYMHWVEAQLAGGAAAALANTACGGNCLTKAREAAQRGISAPANNMTAFFTSKRLEENPWFQFITIERPGYISAGRTLVELLRSRNDPRLEQYFSRVGTQVVGAPPATSINASSLSAGRLAANFRQPMVTYAENQLILAEANFHLGNEAAALTHLNNARQSAGLQPVAATGANLLREIALEAYITLFQNIEAWNVWKRTCTPNLTPAAGRTVIGRPFYGSAERNVNPNIPAPRNQPARNDNDPKSCT